jgi:hypothetical protein
MERVFQPQLSKVLLKRNPHNAETLSAAQFRRAVPIGINQFAKTFCWVSDAMNRLSELAQENAALKGSIHLSYSRDKRTKRSVICCRSTNV